MQDTAQDREFAQDALAIVNEYLMGNLNWRVTPQPNGQLQWGFPNSPPPPTVPSIATIPNFVNEASGFSVDLQQYVSNFGTVTGASLTLISGDESGWSLGGSDGVILSYTNPAPAPAAAVGYNLKTFDSTTLGTLTGQLQPFNFYGVTAPTINGPALKQNSDGSFTMLGNNLESGLDTFDATVATASYNASNSRSFQGVGFAGGLYYELQASFTGTPDGSDNSLSINLETIETASGSQGFTNNQWTEIDYPETNVASGNQWGTSLHHWWRTTGSNTSANPAMIVGGTVNGVTYSSSSPVTAPAGFSFANKNIYGCLWVPATATTQGYIRFYLNSSPIGTQVINAQGIACNAFWNQYNASLPPTGLQIGSCLDNPNQHLMVMTGVNNNSWPATVYFCRVWQASAANNLVQ